MVAWIDEGLPDIGSVAWLAAVMFIWFSMIIAPHRRTHKRLRYQSKSALAYML